MGVFIDTSAFYAPFDCDNAHHKKAAKQWASLLGDESRLFSSNYVTIETTALLQNRLRLGAALDYCKDILPAVEIVWVDELTHNAALSSFFVAERRKLSLVDCTSFEIMRVLGIETAFAFDKHFREQNFRVLPD